jgi:hypothetical protein
MAAGTSCLRISLIPNKAVKVNPVVSTYNTPLSSFYSKFSEPFKSFFAIIMVLNALFAILAISASIIDF